MSIAQRQEGVVAEFQAIPEWEDRYKAIIALARQLAPMPEAHKTEERKVRGCASTVWLYAHRRENRIDYEADSDAVLVRGLVALVLRVYSGATIEEILASQPEFIERIGLNANLSPNRANGLAAMVTQIKRYALDALMEMKRQKPTEVTPKRNPAIDPDMTRRIDARIRGE